MNATQAKRSLRGVKRAQQLLRAAASAAAVQLFCAGVNAQTPATPTITECQVYQGQSSYMESHYSDYNYKPYFTVDWDTSNYYGNNPVEMFFWFGNGCTDINNATNVWQVYEDPAYNSTNTFVIKQDGLGDPETFFPFQAGSYIDDSFVWNRLDDINYDTTYEIGVMATDGNSNNTPIVWTAASFNDG